MLTKIASVKTNNNNKRNNMLGFALLSTLVITGLGGMVGCAPQERLDDLLNTNRTLQSRVVTLEQDLESSNSDIDHYRQQAIQAEKDRDLIASRLNNIQADYQALLNKIDSLEIPTMLPIELNDALRSLAGQYPDLMTYDSQRGMIRFASDLTFDLGSDQVKSNAGTTLTKLAEILNSSEAASFEVLVVGHTDRVGIKQAATLAKHPTNMHLSVHRAISVRDKLVGAGIDARRVGVAGYGEFRPLAPNNKTLASPADRRVEIFILPTVISLDDLAPPAVAATDTQAAPTGNTGAVNEIVEPMK